MKQSKKLFKGIYISADDKIKEKTKGIEDDFKALLGGNCDTYSIGNGYEIIYNKKSKDENKFLLSNVHYSNIQGPIIIYNTEEDKVSLEKIRETLKKISNQLLIDI